MRTTAKLLMPLVLASGIAFAQFPPDEDTYVTSDTPGANFGSQPVLLAEANKTRILIRFAVAGSLPADARAFVKLYASKISGSGTLEFRAVQLAGAWSESSVNNSNFPALAAMPAITANLSAGSGQGYTVFDITAIYKAWTASARRWELVILPKGTLKAEFDSRENTATSHPAELIVIPEPAPAGGSGGPPGPRGPAGPPGPQGPPGTPGAMLSASGQPIVVKPLRAAMGVWGSYNPVLSGSSLPLDAPPRVLRFDGDHIWAGLDTAVQLGSRDNQDSLLKIRASDMAVLGSYSSRNLRDGITGMVLLGNQLIAVGPGGGAARFSTATGAELPFARTNLTFDAIAFDGQSLWGASSGGVMTWGDINGFDASISGSGGFGNAKVNVMQWDGEYLWLGLNRTTDNLVKYETRVQGLGSVKAMATIGSGPVQAITFDGDELWVATGNTGFDLFRVDPDNPAKTHAAGDTNGQIRCITFDGTQVGMGTTNSNPQFAQFSAATGIGVRGGVAMRGAPLLGAATNACASDGAGLWFGTADTTNQKGQPAAWLFKIM